MPGQTTTTLVKQGAFDADLMNALNTQVTNFAAQTPGIVANSANSAFAFGSFGTAITLLAANHPAGTYRVNVYAVVTTTIVTATSWLFPIAFTDDKQAQTPTVSTSSTLTAGTAQQASYTLRSTGATALTVTPTATSISAGVIAYSVVVERLL